VGQKLYRRFLLTKERILIVDDEEDILELLRFNINREGYETLLAESGEKCLSLARSHAPDLIILDLMLPGIDGLDVCKELKADDRTKSIPIIMLTAKTSESDVVIGLELGADDYILKPFSPKVLIARIKSVFRRTGSHKTAVEQEVIKNGGLLVKPGGREVLFQGAAIELTYSEFEILLLLIQKPGWVFSRKQIMAAARKVGPRGSLRPEVISTLIGLLYATGLRIGEALNLTLADVNLKGSCLIIHRTKFDKSRYVPLSSSTVRQLNSFLYKRKKAGFSIKPTAPVFVNPNGQSYGASTVYTVFLEIVRDLKLRGPKGERGPRIHDFRHSFAVNRLAAWYKQGIDLSTKLPLLATYLGHTTMICTGVYLHATAELLEKTNRRFHNHFMIPSFIHEEDNHVKNN